MSYDLSKIKLPEACEIVKHEQEKEIQIKKGNYLLKIEISPYRSVYRDEYLSLSGQITKHDEVIERDLNSYYVTIADNDGVKKAIDNLKKYPTVLEEENKFLSPHEIVGPGLGFVINSTGVTGTIKKYFYLPCVIAYAINNHSCYMIIRMKRGGFKGLLWIGGEHVYSYFARVEEIHLQHALKGISDIINIKPQYQEISPEYKNTLISRMV